MKWPKEELIHWTDNNYWSYNKTQKKTETQESEDARKNVNKKNLIEEQEQL